MRIVNASHITVQALHHIHLLCYSTPSAPRTFFFGPMGLLSFNFCSASHALPMLHKHNHYKSSLYLNPYSFSLPAVAWRHVLSARFFKCCSLVIFHLCTNTTCHQQLCSALVSLYKFSYHKISNQAATVRLLTLSAPQVLYFG